MNRALNIVPGSRLVGGGAGVRTTAVAVRDTTHEVGGVGEVLKLIVRSIPAFAKLLFRIVGDRRVPLRYRASLIALALYVVIPLDPIPDVLPFIGQMDDALLIALVLRWVVRNVDPTILAEHWTGAPEMLELLERSSG